MSLVSAFWPPVGDCSKRLVGRKLACSPWLMKGSREKFLVGFLFLSVVSKDLLVKKFVDAIADLFEVWPTIPIETVKGG